MYGLPTSRIGPFKAIVVSCQENALATPGDLLDRVAVGALYAG